MKAEIAQAEEDVSLPKSLSETARPQSAGASVTGAVIAASVEAFGAGIGHYRRVMTGIFIETEAAA